MTICEEECVFRQSAGSSGQIDYGFFFHRAELPFADQTSPDNDFVLEFLRDVVIAFSATLRIRLQRKSPQRENVKMTIIVVDLFWIDATRINDVLRLRAHSRTNYRFGDENVV